MVHAYCIQLFKSYFICHAFLCHVVSVLAPGEIGYIFDVSQLCGSVYSVVSCAVVWCGCGVVWCAVVCCGVVWCGVGVVWCAVGVLWCGCAVVCCGVV